MRDELSDERSLTHLFLSVGDSSSWLMFSAIDEFRFAGSDDLWTGFGVVGDFLVVADEPGVFDSRKGP